MSSFFKPLTMNISHAKVGIFGGTGAGKTTSAALMAIGIHKHFKCKGPVALFDTENSAGWLVPLFKLANIECVLAPSRAFGDLAAYMRAIVKEGVEVGMIDSITHPWRELMTAYKRKKGRSFISIRDWGPLKDEWNTKFSVPYLNSPVHLIMCGRSANIFEDIEDQDAKAEGKRDVKSIKVGTRMSTEGETGYEPYLLIEMVKAMQQDGGRFHHEATVLKDKSGNVDGTRVVFEMPQLPNGGPDRRKLLERNEPFALIQGHCMYINRDGDQASGLPERETSAEEFENPTANSQQAWVKAKEQAIEDLETLLVKHFPGSTASEKRAKGDLIEAAFGTRAWGRVKAKKPEDLSAGVETLARILRPEHTDKRIDALAQGYSDDGKKVEDPNASVEALRKLINETLVEDASKQSDEDLDEALPAANV